MNHREIDWEAVPENPDPEQDLGYSGDEWDCFPIEQRGDEHRLFLPPEEEHVWQEEFIIAEVELVCELEDAR